MLRTRKKWISLLVVLTFLLSLLPAGMASAATTYGALTAPTVVPQTPPARANLGTITIAIDTLDVSSHSALISLPAGFERDPANPPVATVVKSTGGTTTSSVYTVAGFAYNEFRLDITQATAAATDVLITVTLPNILIPSDAEGDVVATITGLGGQLPSGSVVVGKASTGAVEVTLVDTVTLTSAGATNVQINIKENAAGALKRENNTLKLTLPKGFTWDTTGATAIRVNDGTNLLTLASPWTLGGNGTRTLIVNRSGDGLAKSVFRITAAINVNEDEASFGDVVATVGGTSSASPSSITIGTYADYGVSVVAKDAPDVIPGRTGEEIGDIEVKEKIADSIVGGRTVILELPSGAKWAAITPTVSGGGLSVAAGPTAVGTDGRKVKFTINNATGGGKGTLLFENMEVDLAVDFTGDLTVKVSGTAGVTGELVVAKAKAPLTATADKPQVKIGIREQAAGDITIVEGKKEALKAGKDLTLTLPAGVVWAKLPTIQVVAGDVELDLKAVSGKNTRVLTIPVRSQSSVASTIKISDIQYTIDRTVPEGVIEVKIAGTAVDEANDPATTDNAFIASRTLYTINNVGDPIFPQSTVAARVVNAECITPAPGETKGTAVFKINDAKYVLNGQEVTMDVAPYIKDGRTFLPVRFAANAVGVSDANIIWDGVARKVTVIKGDRVVQMTIGSKVLLLNGAAITMDVAPEIVSGRTMLPIRFLAQALGADIQWNADTQEVTINF